MASYVESILNRNETILYKAHMSNIIYVIPSLLILLFGIGIIFIIYVYILQRTNEYAVTNQRVILKSGIIARNIFEMRLKKIEAISVDQSIMGRIFNYGTMRVIGTGGSSPEFKYLDKPIQFKHAIENAEE